MQLRGQEFGNVFCAPGARGFFGEGYPFHRLWRSFGLNWIGTTFAAKTVTIEKRKGNMPLKKDGVTPRSLIPRCIVINWITGHVLNSVNLSNHGWQFYLQQGRWQNAEDPIVLSHMSMGETKHERLEEDREFVRLMQKFGPFRSPIAIQKNWGCPNTGHDLAQLHQEIGESNQTLAPLGYAIIANFSAAANPDIAIRTLQETQCDALWWANSIKWDSLSMTEKKQAFGTLRSPLTPRGFTPGGLSGPICLTYTEDRLQKIIEAVPDAKVIVGNGIQNPRSAKRLMKMHASGVAIGSIAIVRPWGMQPTICSVPTR
jgi:dihydroorotate dehydrogenase